MADTNPKFYKRVTNDPAFGERFRDGLFERVTGERTGDVAAHPWPERP